MLKNDSVSTLRIFTKGILRGREGEVHLIKAKPTDLIFHRQSYPSFCSFDRWLVVAWFLVSGKKIHGQTFQYHLGYFSTLQLKLGSNN
jgi:hypothetical protein